MSSRAILRLTKLIVGVFTFWTLAFRDILSEKENKGYERNGIECPFAERQLIAAQTPIGKWNTAGTMTFGADFDLLKRIDTSADLGFAFLTNRLILVFCSLI